MNRRWMIVALAAVAVLASGGYAWLASSHGSCSTDPGMASVCRFSCATPAAYDPAAVVAQPGAREGDLTRCPVSGVVFTVASDRPHARAAGKDYVLCCDQCVAKFEKEPARFVKL